MASLTFFPVQQEYFGRSCNTPFRYEDVAWLPLLCHSIWKTRLKSSVRHRDNTINETPNCTECFVSFGNFCPLPQKNLETTPKYSRYFLTFPDRLFRDILYVRRRWLRIILPQIVRHIGRRVRRQRQRFDVIGHVGCAAAGAPRVDVRGAGHFPGTVETFRAFW